jgi:hypothetical protein
VWESLGHLFTEIISQSAPEQRRKCKFSLTLSRVNCLLFNPAKCRRHNDASLHLCLAGDVNLPGRFVLGNLVLYQAREILSFRFCGKNSLLRVTFKRMCVELLSFLGGYNNAYRCGVCLLKMRHPYLPQENWHRSNRGDF